DLGKAGHAGLESSCGRNRVVLELEAGDHGRHLRLDQDAAVLKQCTCPTYLGAPHQLAPPEQDLVRRRAIKTHWADDGLGRRLRFWSEDGGDAQPLEPGLQGKTEPSVRGE